MSGRSNLRAGSAGLDRSDAGTTARAAAVRRSAWLLALVAIGFYLGFIAWNVLRATG